MFSIETKIRTRYAEVDRMGYVYYGNYATYFEVARVEAMRKLGLSYRQMEDSGILMPVVKYEVDYKKAAYYDEVLTITCLIKELPQSRINFYYETRNDKGELLNTALTQLVFVSSDSGRPRRAPDVIVEPLKQFLS